MKKNEKSIIDRIQDFNDILLENKLTPEEFEKECAGLPPHKVGHNKELLIASAYNEGKLPDYTDGTPKYCPVFKQGSPSGSGFSVDGCDGWVTGSAVGARLDFHGPDAKAHLLDAVKKFLPEYKQSRTT